MKLGKDFDIIIRPIFTEKTSKLSENKYCFEVVREATKDEIKNAVQNIFDVVVENLNVINIDGKEKRYKGTIGRRNSVKKVIVTLKSGQNINLSKLE